MKVFIIGVGGFIGSHLAEAILEHDSHVVLGLDTQIAKLGRLTENPRLSLVQSDMVTSHELIEEWIRMADVVIPLAALPLPASYVRQPIATFDLTFVQNLRIVKLCAHYSTRLLFLSSSEVYGMCQAMNLQEDITPLILGPTEKSRWIYASCKQLLERVIFAYGEEQGLRFTIVRPFNWIGPRQDDLNSNSARFPRVVVQFIRNMLLGEPLLLLNGGTQKRCFLYISDGIDLLLRILSSSDSVCDGQVFNAGSPSNETTISELVETLLRLYRERYSTSSYACPVSAVSIHGPGYQDTEVRRPCIKKANDLLGWHPSVDLKGALDMTLDHYLHEWENNRA